MAESDDAGSDAVNLEQEILDVLKRSRARIETPGQWMRGYFRDYSTRGPDTCRVCASGAVRWATTGDPAGANTRLTLKVLRRLEAGIQGDYPQVLVDFNDSHKHADVLELFDAKINEQELLVAQLKVGAE